MPRQVSAGKMDVTLPDAFIPAQDISDAFSTSTAFNETVNTQMGSSPGIKVDGTLNRGGKQQCSPITTPGAPAY